jgi:hypothetical protein
MQQLPQAVKLELREADCQQRQRSEGLLAAAIE